MAQSKPITTWLLCTLMPKHVCILKHIILKNVTKQNKSQNLETNQSGIWEKIKGILKGPFSDRTEQCIATTTPWWHTDCVLMNEKIRSYATTIRVMNNPHTALLFDLLNKNLTVSQIKDQAKTSLSKPLTCCWHTLTVCFSLSLSFCLSLIESTCVAQTRRKANHRPAVWTVSASFDPSPSLLLQHSCFDMATVCLRHNCQGSGQNVLWCVGWLGIWSL